MFDRTIWNFHDFISYRTNNICETYNKRINGLITKPNPNLFMLIDCLKQEEALTAVNYEKANLGKSKSRRTKNELKDSKIEILKLKYNHDEIEIMDYLMELSNYINDFE